jgi:hypothetical protein
MTVSIQTSDNKFIQLDSILVNNSVLLKNLIEDTGIMEGVIPIKNVSFQMFQNILTLLEMDDKKSSLEGLDREEIIELVVALNFLNIEELLDVVCKEIADRISNMSLEDMKSYIDM